MGNRGKASTDKRRQLVELHAAVLRALPDMDRDIAQGWINNHRGLAKVLREALVPPVEAEDPVDVDAILAKWRRFCKEVFGRELDVSVLKMPAALQDINFPLFITEDLETIIAKCRDRFKRDDGSDGYWQWTDKDLSTIVTSDRTAKKGAYVVLVRQHLEADEQHRNKSANQLEKAGVKGMTLEERLTYELFYHWETGEHLDRETWTLCAGSRYSDGVVPHVDFGGDGVRVGCCSPDRYGGDLRAREVVV